jgi:hypothetical protein
MSIQIHDWDIRSFDVVKRNGQTKTYGKYNVPKKFFGLNYKTKPIFDEKYFAFISILDMPNNLFTSGHVVETLFGLKRLPIYISNHISHANFLRDSICDRPKFGIKDPSSPFTYDINSAYPYAMTEEMPYGTCTFEDGVDDDSWTHTHLGFVEVSDIVEPKDLQNTYPFSYDLVRLLASKKIMTSKCYMFLKSIGYTLTYIRGCKYQFRGRIYDDLMINLYKLRKTTPELNDYIKTETNKFLGHLRKKPVLGMADRSSQYDIFSFMMFYSVKYMIDLLEILETNWTGIYVDAITFVKPIDRFVGKHFGQFKLVNPL